MDRVRFAAFAVVTLVAPVMSAPVSAAAQPAQRRAAGADIRELDRTRFTLDGRPLPEHPRYRPGVRSRAAAAGTPAVGAEREWLGLDDTTGKYYKKKYKLRAVGKHIEVWVADDLAFPAGDCRKNAIEVTDADAAGLVRDFDDTIYPKETAAFSTPPDRDGTRANAPGDFTGAGDKTVTLVDNVRDDNYYHFPKAVTYVAGFFSAQLNELFDRNVMTIDAYDWKHRLGADPADDSTDDLCTSRPARPRMYESTFAHEWQHLLEYYADPDEADWVNEGLSDYAQTLVGYVDGRTTVYDRGSDNHLFCFQGFGTVKTKYNNNPRECGGPQNSLNLWDEGAPGDVLADYGNAYQFMLYLHDRFGAATISLLHRDGIRHGLAGVQAALPTGTSLYDVVHDFQTMTLVDKIVGEGGGTMLGVPLHRVTAAGLRSTVNLANKADYDTPGAAPNGADYVPLPTPACGPSRSRGRGRCRRCRPGGAWPTRRCSPATRTTSTRGRCCRGGGSGRAADAAARDGLRQRGLVRLRLRDRLDRRRQDLSAGGGRPHGPGPARPGPDRGERRGGHRGIRPHRVRGKEGSGRVCGMSATPP